MNNTIITTSSPSSTFCDLKQFSKDFRNYHIYFSFTICIMGSILNTFNIFILSTKPMRSPTNLILTALASADVILMLEYMPFSYLQHESASYYTFNFASFLIFHAVFTNAFHFISCSLAIILAVWRYIAVKFPQNNQNWCDFRRTKYTIAITCIFCVSVCIPVLVSMKINTYEVFKTSTGQVLLNKNLVKNFSDGTNMTIFLTGYRNGISKDITFYVYGIVLKLIPCILLAILSVLLVIELFKAKQRKKLLMSSNNSAVKLINRKNQKNHYNNKEKQFNRTTKMLLVVLFLFLMAEFPQAIMGLLMHILGEKFAQECYVPLGDSLDIFTLTISAINFVLYCIMSQKFRELSKQYFLPFIPCCGNLKKSLISLQTFNTVV